MSVQLRVLFLCAFSFCIGTAGTASQLYDMPFKGEDLRDDERVYWGRAIHSSGGVQKYGYDLDVRRYNTAAKRWIAKTGSKNRDWIGIDLAGANSDGRVCPAQFPGRSLSGHIRAFD